MPEAAVAPLTSDLADLADLGAAVQVEQTVLLEAMHRRTQVGVGVGVATTVLGRYRALVGQE
jgi:hypothetical protein